MKSKFGINSLAPAYSQALRGSRVKTQNLYLLLKAHANRRGVCHCVGEIIQLSGAKEQDVRVLFEQHLIDITKQEDTIVLL